MGHHHGHDHVGDGSHGIGRLAGPSLWTPPVHRLGRRRFLAELGRGAFAMAIVGTGVAACSGDDDTSAAAPTSSATPEPTTATEPTPVPEATAEPDTQPDPEPDEAAELAWSQVGLGFVSAYVLVRGSEAAVVDTGTPGSGDEIGEALATLGAGWSEVRHVVLTHSHGDHVGGLSEVLVEAPTATAYAGEADIANIRSPNPLQAVADGDDVLGLQIIETPGHTAGSISLLDRGIGLLIAGDALNGNADGTDVSIANRDFSDDMVAARDSVQRLAGLEFETVVFGHGNPVLDGADDLVAELAARL